MELTSEGRTWCGVEELEPLVRGYVGRRCRDRSEVDDVVQETLIRAARYRPRVTDPDRLRRWAVRIASNVMRDLLRRDGRMRVAESIDDELACPRAGPLARGEAGDESQFALGSVVVDQHTAMRHLRAALERAREADRRLLCAYYAGSRNGARVAAECGFPPGQIKVRLFRARRRVRRELLHNLLRELGAPPVRAPLAESMPVAVPVGAP